MRSVWSATVRQIVEEMLGWSGVVNRLYPTDPAARAPLSKAIDGASADDDDEDSPNMARPSMRA